MSFGDRRQPLRRRTPLQQAELPRGSSSLRRTTMLRARAPRRADHHAAVAEACRAALARDGGRCQAVGLLPGGCIGPLDPHHVIPRSTAPELAACIDNLLAVCRQHHDLIGHVPVEARRLGLHGHAGDNLADLAARRRAGVLAPPAKGG